MSDDRTRTGFGFGRGADSTKTSTPKRVTVRLKSGKVFGPYQRSEVLSFIYARKLSGEESILLEDARDWIPITSDVEFFDAFQEVLFPNESIKNAKNKPNPEAGESKSFQQSKTRTELQIQDVPEKKTQSKTENIKYTNQQSAKIVDLGRGRAAPLPDNSTGLEPSLNQQNSDSMSAQKMEYIQAPKAALNQKTPKNKTLLLAVGMAVVGIFVVLNYGVSKGVKEIKSEAFGSFSAQSWYARPLAVAMDTLSLTVGALPSKLESSAQLSFPDGFNASVWIEDLKDLETQDPKLKLSTQWWLRWSWSAYWLGMTVWTFDKSMGEQLMDHATSIVENIEAQGLLKEPAESMFKGAREFRNLQWEDASKTFDLVSAQSHMAAWLSEESKWLAFWGNGGKGDMPKRAIPEYDSGPLETSSQVRSAFAERDNEKYVDWIEQLAAQDPISSTLWFTTAQVNWRFNKEGTQTANKLFTIGLGALSLQPQPTQLVYWTQFSEFLGFFGRQATTSKAQSNRDAIFNGNLERDAKALGKWWDLNQSEFDMNALAFEIYKRSEKGVVSHRDLATLYVLGYVIPGGAKYLAVAGNHFALEKNWGKASQIFKQISKIDRNAPEGWGGLVWVNASLFRFDDAFNALDELNKLSLVRPENLKYEGILYSLGREYQKANEFFDQYIRKAPNDPWAHYFQALNYVSQEMNVPCVASSNLALAHAQGELQQKAKLLLYRCRVLAKIQVKEAIGDLEKMAKDEPNNPAIASELIDAQLVTDLVTEAAQFTENSIRRFPRSYDLRIKRGDIYRKTGDFDRAVAFYQRAMKDRPESVEPMIKIAEVYESQGKILESAQSFEAASYKSPDWPEVFLMAARAYTKAKKFPDAARLFEREVDARPAHVAAFLEAAEFYLSNNDPHSVIRVFSKISVDYQETPRVRTRMAQAYLALRQMENAEEQAHRAIAVDPKIGEAHRVLGLVYDEQGQYEIAKKHLENYLMLIPGAVDADTIRNRISNPPYR